MQTATTQLLRQATKGNGAAAARLLPLVYDELRELARRYVARGKAAGAVTLQPTDVVHEAYLRLVDPKAVDFKCRTHFFAAAAVAMRCVLVDHARARGAQKRGGLWHRVTLDRAVAFLEQPEVDLLSLDEALTRLAGLNQRAAKVVELRFFGGLTCEKVAQYLDLSERTVKGDWRMARAWLRTELEEGER